MIISVRDGKTPYIGDNGNWFIGKGDTGVHASGQTTTSIQTVTLTMSGWSNLSQTISCPGILEDKTKQVITIFPFTENKSIYMKCNVACIDNGANTLTFTANTVPTEDIDIYVAIEEAGQAPLDVYSTEEKVVGTWIDGKPVYQNIIILGANYTISAGKKNTLPINAENIAQIIEGKPIFISDTDAGVGSGSVWKSSDALIFSSWDGWDARSDRTVCLVLRYTKTTDTATAAIPSATALMAAYEEGVQES